MKIEFENLDIFFRGLPPANAEIKYYEIVNGKYTISSAAFNDRTFKPSIDLSRLCNNSPRHELEIQRGILKLVYSEIMTCSELTAGNDVKYSVNVHHRPEETNFSHCQIESSPEFANRNHFRKLRESLARIADWHIKPLMK